MGGRTGRGEDSGAFLGRATAQVNAEDRRDRAAARKAQQPTQQPTQQSQQPTQQPRQSSRLDDGLAAAKKSLSGLIASFRNSIAPSAPTAAVPTAGSSAPTAAIGAIRSDVNQQAAAGKKAVRERSKKKGRASTILTSGSGLGLSPSSSSARKTLLGE